MPMSSIPGVLDVHVVQLDKNGFARPAWGTAAARTESKLVKIRWQHIITGYHSDGLDAVFAAFKVYRVPSRSVTV